MEDLRMRAGESLIHGRAVGSRGLQGMAVKEVDSIQI